MSAFPFISLACLHSYASSASIGVHSITSWRSRWIPPNLISKFWVFFPLWLKYVSIRNGQPPTLFQGMPWYAFERCGCGCSILIQFIFNRNKSSAQAHLQINQQGITPVSDILSGLYADTHPQKYWFLYSCTAPQRELQTKCHPLTRRLSEGRLVQALCQAPREKNCWSIAFKVFDLTRLRIEPPIYRPWGGLLTHEAAASEVRHFLIRTTFQTRVISMTICCGLFFLGESLFVNEKRICDGPTLLPVSKGMLTSLCLNLRKCVQRTGRIWNPCPE